jgi:hypothetical protein
MPYLPPRAGYALVLLGTALGPVAGPRGTLVSAAPPAPSAPAPSAAVDPSQPQVVLIPCVSGMCQLPLHGTPALTPFKPGPPSPASPYLLADR